MCLRLISIEIVARAERCKSREYVVGNDDGDDVVVKIDTRILRQSEGHVNKLL